MISVNLLTTTDDNRKILKSYSVNATVNADIYDSCDLYNPTLILKTNSVITSNYLYIPNFNRYYFILNKNLDKAGNTIIYCECDVLMSFSTAILNSTQMIIRSADLNNEKVAKSLIVDTKRPVKPMTMNENVQITNATNINYSNNYILTALGGSTGKFAKPIEPSESEGDTTNES